jgi:hypothetical protein
MVGDSNWDTKVKLLINKKLLYRVDWGFANSRFFRERKAEIFQW